MEDDEPSQSPPDKGKERRPKDSWAHPVFGARDRKEAIEATWADYDRYPGHRRLPAAKTFRITQVRRTGYRAWLVWVRKAKPSERKKGRVDDEA